MTDKSGGASARTRPIAVGLVLLVGLVIAVVITATTGPGSPRAAGPALVTRTTFGPTDQNPGPGQGAGVPGGLGPSGSAPTGTAPSGTAPSGTAATGTAPGAASPSGTAPATTQPTPVATSAGLVPGRTLSGVAGVGTDGMTAFGAWRGKPVDVVVDYVGTKTWDGVTQLKREGLLDRGLPATVHRVFSVPLIPSDDNATLAQGAAGAYDQHFRDLAQELVDGGQANATIRLGWEMTGSWFAWSGVAHPDQWVGAFQKAVTAMRSVTGSAFSYDWTVAMGFADPEPMYPGDDYVDVIGADNYDASFATNYQPTDHPQVWAGILSENWGLDWLGKFAGQHGKRISFGEWGISQRQDGHGGGDDPYFIEQMHAWMVAHDVAYEAYFNSVDSSVAATFAIDNGQFPEAAKRYKALFGGSDPGPGATAPGAPQPST